MEENMDIVNEKVRHERFGRGVVVEQHDTSIVVEFDDGEVRTFAYPSAFEKFLVADNDSVKSLIHHEISAMKLKSKIDEKENSQNGIVQSNAIGFIRNERYKDTFLSTNAQNERRYFWNLFQNYLIENGNPFELSMKQDSNGQYRHYAHVCNGNGAVLTVDFIISQGILRMGLYISDNINLYEQLKMNKDTLEKALNFAIAFTDGDRNKNIKHIKKEWSFTPYRRDDYRRVIIDSFSMMKRFVKVFAPFLGK